MALTTTTDDLVRRFRSDVDDVLRGADGSPDSGSLWSIQDVSDYMSAAADMVARRTLSQFETFDVDITATVSDYPLPTDFKVLDIQRARLRSAKRTLDEFNIEQGARIVDDYNAARFGTDWEDLTGSPRAFTRNYKPGYLRLVPTPVDNDTLTITASISPLIVDGDSLPFTEEPDVYLMLLWMKKLAYSKHDADTFDPVRAATCEAEFEARATDRRYEARRVRRAPQSVQFSW